MTHNSTAGNPALIIQVDSVINRLHEQEIFFRKLLPNIEVINLSELDSALLLLKDQASIFLLFVIHESCLSEGFTEFLPPDITIAIITDLKLKPNTKLVLKSINFVNSPLKKSWFKPILENENESDLLD